MSQTYFAVLTEIGEAKLARAATLGTSLALTAMAVGDGNGATPTPTSQQTSLVNEVRRAPLNQLSIDPKNSNHIIAEQVIPENEGGWWIREIGLYDEAGMLCAVANAPPTYKPVLAEGSGRVQVIRMVLLINSQNAEHIELKIDPSIVLATREYVVTVVTQHEKHTNPHPQYAKGSDLLIHLEAGDPHPQYAPLHNPKFTGMPEVPTPTLDSPTEQATNINFVNAQINRRSIMINLLPDSGRFYDPEIKAGQQFQVGLTADFLNTNFTLYSTAVTGVGKFSHDNRTHGGIAPDLSPLITDFLQVIKRQQKRYGQEFYIAEFSAGAVNTHPRVIEERDTYLSTSAIAVATGLLTFSTWMRCIKGAVALDVTTHKNGVPVESPLVLPNEGWVHCSGTVDWDCGYSIIHFRCEPHSVFQIALPAFLLGDFSGMLHKAPLPSFYSFKKL